jgi:hypothetical protein
MKPIPDWIEHELATIDLADASLDRRAQIVLEQLANKPSLSIPKACAGWTETQGAYRLFNHPRVTRDALLEPHRQATLQRIGQHPVVLLIQDTTELDFTRPQKPIAGAGRLNYERRHGFYLHPLIAVTPERLPLGTLAATLWAREPKDDDRDCDRLPIEQKESYRWLEGYRQAAAVARDVPQTQIVCISDREGDIYECLVAGQRPAQGPFADWIIRAEQDRRLSKAPSAADLPCRLWERRAATAAVAQVTVRVPRSGPRPPRKATLTVYAATVPLAPPARPAGCTVPPITINAVLIREEAPPAGQEPIEWLLLTSLPVGTRDQALLVVAYYTCRWMIEIFFHVYKSGCRVEHRRFATAAALAPCLALYLIVGRRLLWLTMLGRDCPELPCDAVFDAAEWKSVWTVVRQEPPPPTPPVLNVLLALVARLGGYLGRKGDGPPGVETMWTGLQRMTDLALAWTSFGPESHTFPLGKSPREPTSRGKPSDRQLIKPRV